MQDSKIYFIYIIFPIETTGYTLKTLLTLIHGIIFNALTLVHFIPILYPDRPWGPPSLLYNGYRIFPRGKGGRDVTLTTHPPSSAEVMKE
jgi:hypothetical protein